MATYAQSIPTEVIASTQERRRIVDSALGTTLAEGVSPGPEVIALSGRYVCGEITLQELGSAVRSMSRL